MSRIAVVMSVYKNDDITQLKEAVESVLTQSYSNVDLFLYRDGIVSGDVQEYLDYISNFESVNLEQADFNSGLAFALNSLIDSVLKVGNYDYIARMDSDDISYPSRISEQIAFMSNNADIDVSGTFCREFGSDFAQEVKKVPCSHSLLIDYCITRCPFIHPTVIFKSKVFEDGARYPLDTSLTEDMGLWFYLLDKGYRFGNLDKVLLDYRLNDTTLDRRKGSKKALSEITLRFKYMKRLSRINLNNLLLVSFRGVFHLLPKSIVRFAYKNLR